MTALSESTLQAFRARRPSDFSPVALGYRTVDLVATDQLDEAQVGYAVDTSGRRLVGTESGAWAPEWLVVAIEDELGDPLFVDTGKPSWPVFTAPHGEGRWEPDQIADSFEGFLAALEVMRTVARGRETPVARESNPVSDSERDRALGVISASNPRSSATFWETWLEEF